MIKRHLVLLSCLLLIALIVIVSLKLSDDALAVIIGVGLGVLASIPTSLLIAYVLTRHSRAAPPLPAHRQSAGLPGSQQPPVVIVNGGQQPGLNAGQRPPPAYQMQVPTSRTFTIVGEETTDL